MVLGVSTAVPLGDDINSAIVAGSDASKGGGWVQETGVYETSGEWWSMNPVPPTAERYGNGSIVTVRLDNHGGNNGDYRMSFAVDGGNFTVAFGEVPVYDGSVHLAASLTGVGDSLKILCAQTCTITKDLDEFDNVVEFDACEPMFFVPEHQNINCSTFSKPNPNPRP